MKNIFFLALIITVTIFLTRDLNSPLGFPSTHDGQNHLARMVNYYLALKQGQFPPRFAPNLEAGLGYPVLNFNYPLANLLALPLIVLNIPAETALKLLFTFCLIMSGLGMFYYLNTRFTPLAGLLGSLVYLSSPYQLSNLYIRGNIGESLALALLPWVLLLAIRGGQKPKVLPLFSVFLAMFLLSHNLMALLSLPVILLVLIFSLSSAQLRRLFGPTLTALLLVSFFWLPALAEKHFIVLDQSPLNQSNFSHHFISLRQLVSSVWDHGYSYSFAVDGLSVGLGLLVLFSALVGLPFLFALPAGRQKHFAGLVWLGLITAIFLMLPVSAPIWRLLPYTAIIQFPWRLLFFTTFFGSVLTAFLAKYWSNWLIVLALSLSLFSSLGLRLGINYFHQTDADWFSFPLNTTIANENDPIWYRRSQALEFLDQHSSGPALLDSEGSIEPDIWNGTVHSYLLTATAAARVVEPTLYFPGWTTSIDGQTVDLLATADQFAGLINFQVASGSHQITTRFTQRTPARLIGNSLTLIGFGLLIYQFRKSRS